jgi:hypothetical protein
MRVVAVAGSVELDLREALIAEGTTHIELRSIAGSVEITVPPGVRVEWEGDSVVGSYVFAAGRHRAPGPGAPVIRISGTAIFSSVEAKVRAVGEGWRWPLGRRSKGGESLPPGS